MGEFPRTMSPMGNIPEPVFKVPGVFPKSALFVCSNSDVADCFSITLCCKFSICCCKLSTTPSIVVSLPVFEMAAMSMGGCGALSWRLSVWLLSLSIPVQSRISSSGCCVSIYDNVCSQPQLQTKWRCVFGIFQSQPLYPHRSASSHMLYINLSLTELSPTDQPLKPLYNRCARGS